MDESLEQLLTEAFAVIEHRYVLLLGCALCRENKILTCRTEKQFNHTLLVNAMSSLLIVLHLLAPLNFVQRSFLHSHREDHGHVTFLC